MTLPAGPTPQSNLTTAPGKPEAQPSDPILGEGLLQRAFGNARSDLVATIRRAKTNAKKVAKTIEVWPLYYDAYRLGVQRAVELGFSVDTAKKAPAMFAKATRSISSSAGNCSEKLLAAIARELVAVDEAHLVQYRTASDFESKVKEARKLENPYEVASVIADEFFVTPEHVQNLLTRRESDKKYPSIHYPDSLSVFEGFSLQLWHDSPQVTLLKDWQAAPAKTTRMTFVAVEQKLSGENDSKSIETNTRRLYEFREVCAAGPEGRLYTAVAMPVAKANGTVKNRWVAEAKKHGVDALCWNEGVFPILFARPEPATEHYQRFVAALTSVAADGVVAFLTRGSLTYDDDGEWVKEPTQDSLPI